MRLRRRQGRLRAALGHELDALLLHGGPDHGSARFGRMTLVVEVGVAFDLDHAVLLRPMGIVFEPYRIDKLMR